MVHKVLVAGVPVLEAACLDSGVKAVPRTDLVAFKGFCEGKINFGRIVSAGGI